MTFSYNTGVPATNNDPSVDQPDMLINTQSINDIIGVDHVTFNSANGGTHNQVTLNRLAAKPTVTGTQTALYSKLSGSSSQLFFETSAGTEIQMTGQVSVAANGYTTLFGNITMQWGTFSAGSGTSSTTFPVAFTTAVYSIQITPRFAGSVNDVDVYIIGSPTTSGFSVRNSTGSTWTIYWIAIGV